MVRSFVLLCILHLASSARVDLMGSLDKQVQCEYNGPSKIVSLFPKQNCVECNGVIFMEATKTQHLELPFQNQFVPELVKMPEQQALEVCACNVDNITKVTIQVQRGTCDAKISRKKVRSQEHCWKVYKSLAGFGMVNAWLFKKDSCLECDGDAGPPCQTVVKIPDEKTSDLVGRLRRDAEKGNDDAKDRLQKIKQNGFLSTSYRWVPGKFGDCSKKCADKDGPGVRMRHSKCVPETNVKQAVDARLCELVHGEAPDPETEQCNTQPCQKATKKPDSSRTLPVVLEEPVTLAETYIWVLGDYQPCDKPCTDNDGPGSRSREVKCVLESDHSKSAVSATLCDKAGPALESPEELCNTDPCESFDLKAAGWTKCDKPCSNDDGPGWQSQIFECLQTKDGGSEKVDDSNCDHLEPPSMGELIRQCNDDVMCAACDNKENGFKNIEKQGHPRCKVHERIATDKFCRGTKCVTADQDVCCNRVARYNSRNPTYAEVVKVIGGVCDQFTAVKQNKATKEFIGGKTACNKQTYTDLKDYFTLEQQSTSKKPSEKEKRARRIITMIAHITKKYVIASQVACVFKRNKEDEGICDTTYKLD